MPTGDSAQIAADGAATEPASDLPMMRRLAWPALLLLALGTVLGLCWLLFSLESNRILEQQRQRETVRVSLLAELLRSELRPAFNDVRLLADGDGLREYLDTGRDAGLREALRQARVMGLAHPEYYRIHFVGQDGRELLRVDQGGRTVSGAQRQDLGGSPLFQRASTLPRDALFLSGFDIADDKGAPTRPLLHFAVPVFDSSGERRGVYVIVRNGADLVDRMVRAAGSYSHRVRLLDDEGNWLHAEDEDQQWGNALPERRRFALANTNPALWSHVEQEPDGQSAGGGGVFTWRRLAPQSIAPMPGGQVLSDNAWLVVASLVTRSELAALTTGLRHLMGIAVPALLLFTLLSAWLLRARRKVLAQLRAMNQVLEQRVRERTLALARSNGELQHREALLAETGRLARVGGWEFDPATGEGTWTPEIARIHDLPDTVKPSKDIGLQFYPGESRTRIEAAVRESLASGTPYDLELEFVSARGERKWVRTISHPVVKDGRVVRMRGALQDITDRKLSELRVRTELQRMNLLERTTRAIGERQDLGSILQVMVRTLEEQLPLDFCCVLLYDPADRGLTVTAVGAASLPLAVQFAMQRNARVPIDENGLSRCVRGQLVYEPDIGGSGFPFPQRLAAGGLRSLVAAPLQIESQVFGVLVAARRAPEAFGSGDCEFLRQISEHAALAAHQAQLLDSLKAAYEDLRNTQQAVMQQERLRVLGQMASGIAHDINNAISPIMLYTDSLIEREPGLSERAQLSLRTIQQAVSDVAETVARMREFYRPREAQHELRPVQLNTLLPQLRELTRARWETMPQQQGIVIGLRLELADDLPPVQGIENEIREATINLIFNAVDAMPEGGTLTLRTRAGANGMAMVEVIDTGSGMDEETRRRCLEPFFTTKGERGTGLGLAMVYGVMQRHGGDIDIDSTPGAGTTVRLSFVVAADPAGPSATLAAAVPVNLRLLLVDDDPILLRSLREILEMDGHRVYTADGGQAGIDAFRASLQAADQPISAVITDLGMPHVDGRAVAAAVKQASPRTPVVMLTGWGERLLSEGHTVPHVDRVLSKPPRLRDLRHALAELVEARDPAAR